MTYLTFQESICQTEVALRIDKIAGLKKCSSGTTVNLTSGRFLVASQPPFEELQQQYESLKRQEKRQMTEETEFQEAWAIADKALKEHFARADKEQITACSTLVALLIRKGIITEEEYNLACDRMKTIIEKEYSETTNHRRL